MDAAFKIDRSLLAQLQNGARAPALVVLSEQADVSAAEQLATKEEKGRFVFDALRAAAAQTQPAVRAELDALGLTYRAYYLVNLFAVDSLDATQAARLAALPQVRSIAANPNVRFPEPLERAPAPEATTQVEWGIQKINADDLWAMGIRGQGIVVANADTGVQWQHPALKKRYRGYDPETDKASHGRHWWDAIHTTISGRPNPCRLNRKNPCDDDGHGTHTMGTIVGKTKFNKIGVAPRAKWISCRNMDNGVGRPSTYLECFEFFLAPWNKQGLDPDPAYAPDVVSNSWSCPLGPPPAGEDCEPDSLKQAVENLRAAGIFVVGAAGNSGSQCSTVSDPPAIYNATTTVGATDEDDDLTGFSSRGPVTSDGSGRRKPDLSAPGVSVRSAFPTDSYVIMTGTSMAAPHVAGAVALLWQGKPNLRGQVGETEDVLFASADPHVNVSGECGGTDQNDIPNNLFGYGRLDVFAAYNE